VHRQSFCDGRIGLWGISYGANASVHASLRQATQLPPSASNNSNGNSSGAASLAINDINVITDDDDHLSGAVGRAGSSGALIATTTIKRKRKVVTCVSLYGFWDLYRYEGRKLDAKKRPSAEQNYTYFNYNNVVTVKTSLTITNTITITIPREVLYPGGIYLHCFAKGKQPTIHMQTTAHMTYSQLPSTIVDC
jgi:hypothetical protein